MNHVSLHRIFLVRSCHHRTSACEAAEGCSYGLNCIITSRLQLLWPLPCCVVLENVKFYRRDELLHNAIQWESSGKNILIRNHRNNKNVWFNYLTDQHINGIIFTKCTAMFSDLLHLLCICADMRISVMCTSASTDRTHKWRRYRVYNVYRSLHRQAPYPDAMLQCIHCTLFTW